MLDDALESFVGRQPARARAIIPRDKEVDALNRQANLKLINWMIDHPEAIRRALRFIVRRFGRNQLAAYRGLMLEGRKRLAENPLLGHRREGLPPEARVFHISQEGRPASHFFLYRVADDGTVQVLRVLHKSMDAARHLPKER